MKLSKIEVALLTISLFSSIFFFGYNIITGRIYGGASSDNSYISFMMIVDIIPLYLFVKFFFSGNSQKNVWPIILTLVALVVTYGIGVGTNDINFKCLLAFSFPAALIGILIAKSQTGPYFAKLLEPVMLFLTVVGVVSMRYILSVSVIREVREEGIGTTSLSYYCGFAFALNLYFIFFGDEMKERFNYAKTSLYKYFSIGLLVVQFVIGLSSGGRGGFLLLLFSGAFLVFLRLKRHSARSTSGFFTFILLLFTILIAVQFMPKSFVDSMSRGSERTFSYISGGKFDATETSNRDEVYDDAINAIMDSPLYGHGILMKGTPFYGDRPHNIFLEILIQGGVFYLMLFLLLSIFLVKKMRRLIKRGHGLYMIPVALYPSVMLMFSASYIGTDLFWFVISYILCYDDRFNGKQNYTVVNNKVTRTI